MPAAAHSGAIAFGLVYIPIKLYTAVSEGGVRFNQLHAASGSRIKYKKVREDTGAEVAPHEIVKGYEYEKGKYVVITPEEIERMKTPRDKAITILHFTPRSSIDPLYYDKAYYAVPDGSDKAYGLLRGAMLQQNVVAIAKTVLGTKETLLALSATSEGIIVETMHFYTEIKPMPKSVIAVQSTAAEQNMAQMLVQSMTQPFQPTAYHDEYETRVMEAIQRKINGQEVISAQAGEKSNVIDLMDALQRSLQQQGVPVQQAQQPAQEFVPPVQQPPVFNGAQQ